MEAAVRRAPDQSADDAAHEGPDDADDGRRPETECNRARIEPTGEHAHDEADDDHPDDRHHAHEHLLPWQRIGPRSVAYRLCRPCKADPGSCDDRSCEPAPWRKEALRRR